MKTPKKLDVENNFKYEWKPFPVERLAINALIDCVKELEDGLIVVRGESLRVDRLTNLEIKGTGDVIADGVKAIFVEEIGNRLKALEEKLKHGCWIEPGNASVNVVANNTITTKGDTAGVLFEAGEESFIDRATKVLRSKTCEKCGEPYRMDEGAAFMGIPVIVCGCKGKPSNLGHAFEGECPGCNERLETRTSKRTIFCPCCGALMHVGLCTTCTLDEHCQLVPGDPAVGKTVPCAHWKGKP